MFLVTEAETNSDCKNQHSRQADRSDRTAMIAFLLILCLSASFTRRVISLPTARSDLSDVQHHAKRFTAGPQLGGLNFPGMFFGLAL
jgi:hypothetical protein